MSRRSPADDLPIFTVDAFTGEPFKGNPAAVCLMPFGKEVPDEVKQRIAAEMRHSETAFVSLQDRAHDFGTGSRFGLRWFTPEREVSLCGHATLATSAVLFDICNNPSPVIEFETLGGLLKAKRLQTDIELDLPAYDSEPPADIRKYDNVVQATVGSLAVEEVALSQNGKLLIRLADSVDRRPFEEFQPMGGSELMSAAPELEGVIVTLKGGGHPYDFLSRYFAPWMGILEDPVTGSAHSVLGPYWSKVLKKNEMHARQCSARGGDLDVRVLEDRVAIRGKTCIVLRGHITV